MNNKTIILLIITAVTLPVTSQAERENGQRPGQGNRPSPEEVFERLDADADGSISAEEAKGPIANHFDRIDTDGDGYITTGEHNTAVENMRERVRENREERAAKLQEMDTNGNGSISRDEAGERLLEHFDKIDADGDGEVTREELRSAAQNRRQNGERRSEDG